MQNKRGQKIGPKGARARQAMLESLKKLLDERHPWNISVSDICTISGMKQYNFYTYFEDVEEAVLTLSSLVAREQPELVHYIEGPWSNDDGLDRASAIVSETIEFWLRNDSVLMIADLMADRGSPEFLEVRRLRRRPLVDAFQAEIRGARDAGCHNPDLDPFMAAVDVVTMLDSVGSRYKALELYGYVRKDIVRTHAHILRSRIAGCQSGGK